MSFERDMERLLWVESGHARESDDDDDKFCDPRRRNTVGGLARLYGGGECEQEGTTFGAFGRLRPAPDNPNVMIGAFGRRLRPA